MSSINVKSFFDKATSTLTYLVYDTESKNSIVIDPVLDYEIGSSRISYASIEKLLDFISRNRLNLSHVLETHLHADHLSAAYEIRSRCPDVKIVIGKNICSVQKTFLEMYNLSHISPDGSCFDVLVNDGAEIRCGSILVKAIETPGHTPACVSFLIEDRLFVGDTLFMPDYGTGRCDFPGGSAESLFHSIRDKIFCLPDETKVFVGHDYMPNGRELKFQTTVGESKRENIHLRFDTSKEDFVSFRKERDSKLDFPRLLFPSVQMNIQAGKLPPKESNGSRYLKIPIQS